MIVLAWTVFDSGNRNVGAVSQVSRQSETLLGFFVALFAFCGMTLVYHAVKNMQISTIAFIGLTTPLVAYIILAINFVASQGSSYTGVVVMLLAYTLVLLAIRYRIPRLGKLEPGGVNE